MSDAGLGTYNECLRRRNAALDYQLRLHYTPMTAVRSEVHYTTSKTPTRHASRAAIRKMCGYITSRSPDPSGEFDFGLSYCKRQQQYTNHGRVTVRPKDFTSNAWLCHVITSQPACILTTSIHMHQLVHTSRSLRPSHHVATEDIPPLDCACSTVRMDGHSPDRIPLSWPSVPRCSYGRASQMDYPGATQATYTTRAANPLRAIDQLRFK